MKNIFTVLIILFTASLGFFFGKSQGFKEGVASESQAPALSMEAPKSSMSVEDEKNWLELKEKLQGVTAEQIREYLRTQNADEKLKKADEILGKIVAAMVANIGLRLEKKDLDAFQSPLALHPVDNQPKASAAPVVEEIPAALAKPDDGKKNLARLGQQARNARTEEDVSKILEQLPKEFASRIQSSTNLSSQQIRDLRGNFEGTLVFDKDARSVRTTLAFSGNRRGDNKLVGAAVVDIFDSNGKSVSRGASRGDMSDRFSGNQLSVFIEIGGDYIELIYFPNLDSFYGNYLQSSKGQLTKTGRITYRRAN